jgi:alpha-L-fucosidase
VDVAPHRDLVGDLAKAVRAHGLRMGFYYSLYEWFNPLYLSDVGRYVDEHMIPQFKDAVERYQPAVIFADGEWDHPSEVWKSRELLAWLYNESSCRDEVVVNDRWGKETRSLHGGYFTSEYGKYHGKEFQASASHKWEENQGIGASFGYNRNEEISDYKSARDLIHLLVEIVSRGGNLLLDVGPTADGRIPVIMQERLLEIGEWLKVNGEAIYGTRPWRAAADGRLVRYTSKPGAVYAIALEWPGRELTLEAPQPAREAVVTLLGYPKPLEWHHAAGKLRIEVPPLSVDEVPSRGAHVFKLTGVN